MKDIRCIKYREGDLRLYYKEVRILARLKYLGLIFGLVCCGIGLYAFLRNVIITNTKQDNYIKTITLLTGAFFSTISYFNKGNLLEIKRHINSLNIEIEEYNLYDSMKSDRKKQADKDCSEYIKNAHYNGKSTQQRGRFPNLFKSKGKV